VAEAHRPRELAGGVHLPNCPHTQPQQLSQASGVDGEGLLLRLGLVAHEHCLTAFLIGESRATRTCIPRLWSDAIRSF